MALEALELALKGGMSGFEPAIRASLDTFVNAGGVSNWAFEEDKGFIGLASV